MEQLFTAQLHVDLLLQFPEPGLRAGVLKDAAARGGEDRRSGPRRSGAHGNPPRRHRSARGSSSFDGTRALSAADESVSPSVPFSIEAEQQLLGALPHRGRAPPCAHNPVPPSITWIVPSNGSTLREVQPVSTAVWAFPHRDKF